MSFKKLNNGFHLLFLLLIACTVISCNDDDDQQPEIPAQTISYGNFVKVGNGQARSFIVKNPDGSTKQLGFDFNEEALNSLPAQNTAFKLPMPADNKTMINHISFDYSVNGEEGAHSVPHFDMLFYMLSEKEVDAITLEDPRIDILPSAVFVPKNYIPGPNEAKKGKLWSDSTAHELHGTDFTSTFIYGSYNGKFHFMEPRVSISYLKTKPNVSINISQQAKVQQTGQYPEKYSIAWEKDRKEYRITLDNLTLRQQ